MQIGSKVRQLVRGLTFFNFLHLSLNQGANVLVALLINPILYQRLEEEQYGKVTLSLSIAMLLGMMVGYGFHLNGPKRLALLHNNPVERSRIINEILVSRGYLALIIIPLCMGGIEYLNYFQDYGLILSFSLLIVLSEAFTPLFILQGIEKLSILSKANAASKLLYLILVYFFVQEIEDAKWVNFIFGGVTLIMNLAILSFLRAIKVFELRRVSFISVVTQLSGNTHYFLSTLAGHISVHGGFILLKNFVDDLELGQYALAQRIAFLLRMIPVFLTQSILQASSRLYQEDELSFRAYLKKSYSLGLMLTLFIGFSVLIFAPLIVRIVGGEYVPFSAQVLRVLGFIPFFGMLNVTNMIKILVAERKSVLLKATWITAIIMLILSSIGSYLYGGLGLAIALLLAEIVGFAVHFYLLRANENNS